MFSNYRYQGFSLLELTVCLLLIAMLMITALHRYGDLADEARLQSHHSVIKNYELALSLLHLQWQLRGQPEYLPSNIKESDQSWWMSDQGWPIALVSEERTSSRKRCQQLWQGLLTDRSELLAMADQPVEDTAMNVAEYRGEAIDSDRCRFWRLEQPLWQFEYDPDSGKVSRLELQGISGAG